MTDELKQLAVELLDDLRTIEASGGLRLAQEHRVGLALAEAQRQTVEATASWLVALGEYLLAAKLREEMLSPAQEVRNG